MTLSGPGKYIATKMMAMIGTAEDGNNKDDNRIGGQGRGRDKNIVF